MRRILLIIPVLLFALLGFSQNCISDQNIKEVGFHPKTIEPAYVDSVYKQVLQVRIFKDTSVVLNGNPVLATIDSIVVNGIEGMPTGFYYSCSNKNCTFIPDSTGCATMEGTASKGDIGEYPLEIQIKIYAKIFGTVSTTQDDTIRQFTMFVEDLSSAHTLTKPRTYLYPNPTLDGTIQLSNSFYEDLGAVTCINALGQIVDFNIVNGKIDLVNPVDGLYTITIQTKTGQTFTERVLLKH
jgi:hypothetical protein